MVDADVYQLIVALVPVGFALAFSVCFFAALLSAVFGAFQIVAFGDEEGRR